MLPLIVFVVPFCVLWCLMKTIFKPKKVISVADKVVLITGASSGLGEACAYKFAEAGAKVILSARNVERLREIKEKMTRKFGKDKIHEPKIVHIDLNDLDGISKSAEEARLAYGHVDILVNNAGISYRGSIIETDLDVHSQLMRVNYFGPLVLTKCLLPSMIERKEGHIVAVSSVQGKVAIAFRSAYAASKHATEAFFKCLRTEVAEYNVNVTVVSPGYIRTNLSVNARTSDGSQYGAIDPTTAAGMEPTDVAMEIVNAVECLQEDVIIADFQANLAILLNTLWPSFLFRILKRRAKRQRQQMENISKDKQD